MKVRLRCFRIWVTGGEKVGTVSVDIVLMCVVGVESREELSYVGWKEGFGKYGLSVRGRWEGSGGYGWGLRRKRVNDWWGKVLEVARVIDCLEEAG